LLSGLSYEIVQFTFPSSWFRLMDRRLVDHLVNTSLVTRATMQRHILRANRNKTTVGEELVAASDLTAAQMAEAMAACYGYDQLDVATFTAEPRALKLLSATTAEKHGIIPIALSGSGVHVTVVLYDVESTLDVLETLRMATGNSPTIQIGTKSFIQEAIRHFYFGEAWPNRPVIGRQPELDLVDSGEFLLAEPEVEQAPEPRRDRKPSMPPTPSPPPKPVVAKNPKKDSSKPKADVAQALEDFDAFLDQADIRPSQPAVTNNDAQVGWGDGSDFGSDFEVDPSAGVPSHGLQSGFGGGSVFGNFEANDPSESRDGFDLFEPSEAQLTLHELVEQQEKQVQRLQQEVQNQRDVLAVLVDMLVEARILNRKEVTRLVKARRQ
jgi:hypothetical protein